MSGPETCEIGRKVLIWSCPDLSRRTHMGPIWAHMGSYGPIRAHMGPNPDRVVIFKLCAFLIFVLLDFVSGFCCLSKKRGVFLEDFALTWNFWDMLDMSMFRLLVQCCTIRVQKLNC